MGARRSGKARLIAALSGQPVVSNHVMAVEFYGQCINTPSEFLENRFFYTSLITAAIDCEIIAMVQNATHTVSLFPPLFASMFNRQVVGIVTDVELPDARPDLAERFLRSAGVRQCVQVNFSKGDGLEYLQSLLAAD